MCLYHTKKRIGGLGVALILVTTWACGQSLEGGAPVARPAATSTLQEAARASREDWAVLADEPAVHLWWARDFQRRGNLGSAAEELTKSATMLRWGASQVPAQEEKSDFLEAARELDAAAGAVSWASSDGVPRFERALDVAYRVLASHHVRTALLEWEAGEQPLAAELLRAAATEIEQRFAVLGSPPLTDLDEAVAEARYVADRLATAEAPTEHEVRHAIASLGGVLDRLVEAPDSPEGAVVAQR